MLIRKYTIDWLRDFETLKNEIAKVLSSLPIQIEHVGSTAVPNLDAKPIIDIDIVYYNKLDFEKIKQGLESINYYHNGNQGIEDRDVFKRNGFNGHIVLDSIKHHLYVCPSTSEALHRHILSRDYLRKNEGARQKYQTMKYELAEKAQQNKKLYAELKEQTANAFIDEIVSFERKNNK